MQESVHSCEAGSKCAVQSGPMPDGPKSTVKGSLGMSPSQSFHESNHDRVAQLCQCTFSDIIMSEHFAQLCSLLLGNGLNAEKLFDLSCINSRMKEKAYESSPMLFHSDIQQVFF